ncbi:GIY-YIG nuclease family protein [Leptothrix ochracea]|uniref:GIY-YIG nuclease family protein n=1 Tax=Leptothrix ochracea TaxID=735331 RepID=UPI0034E27F4E
MKSGYLYILVHPSDPDLYKIGVTTLDPIKRLAQHNTQHDKYAGKIVKETGDNWEIKTFISVPDVYFAERAFWNATHFQDIPFRGGIEVEKMEWSLVQKGLEAAQSAGVRPGPLCKTSVRNSEWMKEQLEGTGITMIDRYAGLIRLMEFQCENGHVFKESAGLVANRRSCPCCVDWNWLSGPRKGLRSSIR